MVVEGLGFLNLLCAGLLAGEDSLSVTAFAAPSPVSIHSRTLSFAKH